MFSHRFDSFDVVSNRKHDSHNWRRDWGIVSGHSDDDKRRTSNRNDRPSRNDTGTNTRNRNHDRRNTG